MPRFALPTLTLAVAVSLTACAGSTKTAGAVGPTGASTREIAVAQTSAPAAVTAGQALIALRKAVPTARFTGTVTAANDPNHLLGRPGQYTSKVTFSDSRIAASDTEGLDQGDVERGGAVEVFASADDAARRMTYIQSVTKSMPAFAEYDYRHDTVLVRISKFLTPSQAEAYKKAADALG
ncbi:hypothetical protein [Streptomyces sp900105755]|uniref:Lipoprotein n=1 Tax=Streptomyces sp. 900105755 TaxID=3154389 RepID=A0ABV1TVE7_9ACTN